MKSVIFSSKSFNQNDIAKYVPKDVGDYDMFQFEDTVDKLEFERRSSELVVQDADIVIVIWNGSSRGVLQIRKFWQGLKRAFLARAPNRD